MEIVKKFFVLLPVIVLAFSVAFFVDSLIAVEFQVPDVCNVSNKVKPERHIQVLSGKNIIKYNVFGLFINKPQKKQKVAVAPAIKFNGKLLGLIVGKKIAYAVFKINDNVTIVDNRSNGPIKIKNTTPCSVTVDVNGKIYKLKIEKSKTAEKIATSVETSSSNYMKVKLAKSFAEKSISDINKLMRSVAVYPFYQGSKFVGYRIGSVAYGSLLWRIGLRGGDVVTRVNGEKLDNPQQLFALFSNISNLSAVTVDFYRGGKKKTLLVELY